MRIKYSAFILFGLFGMLSLKAQPDLDSTAFIKLDAGKLNTWNFAGYGRFNAVKGGFTMREADSSKGVMLISKDTLPPSYVVRFKAIPLTASTVFVFISSAAQNGGDAANPYDGNIGYWLNSRNYFVAFRNFLHGSAPYIAVNGTSEPTVYGNADVENDQVLHVEIGVLGGEIWCRVNDRLLVRKKIEKALPGGHWGFRIRGLPGFPAGCLISNIQYYHP